VGPRSAKVVVIARSPSKYDDRAGKPMSGTFGDVLTECLARLGVTRSHTGFVHTVSCFTTEPENRDPTYEEICACADWRERQLSWFSNKKIVLAWGRPAINAVYGGVERMGDIVGELYKPSICRGRTDVESWGVIPFWHPVYLMRDKETKLMFRNVLAPKVKETIADVMENEVPWFSSESQGDLFG